MYCKYCGTEVTEKDKFCQFCGGKIESEDENVKPYSIDDVKSNDFRENQSKKKPNPGKIILIVVLCCTLIQLLILGALYGVANKTNKSFSNTVENFYGINSSDENSNNPNTDDYSNKNKYNISTLKRGTIDVKNRSYKSEMTGLSFSLPTAWEVNSSEKNDQLSRKENADVSIDTSNLYLYDFYAENSLNASVMYICYYNKDFYSEYNNIDEFNKGIKSNISSSFDDSNPDDISIEFADDSKIKLAGKEYDQIATRITDCIRNYTYYEYEFTREIDNYYVEIVILSTDLNSVGEIIDVIK